MSEKQISDGWGEFHILPTPKEALVTAARFVGRLLQHIQYEVPSEHFRGASDHELYDHYKEAYATYDDGATSPSTYSELFEQLEIPYE